jgi:hypothetical protein
MSLTRDVNGWVRCQASCCVQLGGLLPRLVNETKYVLNVAN